MASQEVKQTTSPQAFSNVHCKRSRREITAEDEVSVVFTSTMDGDFMATKEKEHSEHSTERITGCVTRYGGLFRSVSFPLPVWDSWKMSIRNGTSPETISNTSGDVNNTISGICSPLPVRILDCEKQQTKAMQTEEVGSVIVAEEAIAFSPPGMSEGDSSKIVSDGNGLAEERCPAYGSISVIGRRREMEDTVSVVPDFASLFSVATDECHDRQPLSPLHFFGVYDGHGGSKVSSICKERLHCVLAEEVSRIMPLVEDSSRSSVSDLKSEWEAAVKACFLKMDEQVGGVCPDGSCSYLSDFSNCSCDTISPGTVGSTAVVAVVGANQIVVGNCGDSRAVISRSGKAIALTRDHKPEREDERERIETAGGHIVNWCGYRVGGLLAMSRAIGDRCLKPFVIAEPEVTCLERTEEDEFLILATDGLWDVVCNDLACEVVQKSFSKQRKKQSSGCVSPSDVNIPTMKAASALARLAHARGSTDNISVVIVDLKTRQR